MELFIFLAFLAAIRFAAHNGLPPDEEARSSLAPRDMPFRVNQAVRRVVPGIHIRLVRVEMDGPGTVRYHVSGFMPDGREAAVTVAGSGEVLACPSSRPEEELPAAIRQRLTLCLPSFTPAPGGMRLVRGEASSWYEIEGELAGGQPAGVKISRDGHDLLMTLPDTRV